MANELQRVRAGVQFLNARQPDWKDKINVDTFDVNSMSDCVLGQLFGYYMKGLNTLKISVEAGYELGFDIRHEPNESCENQWNELQHYWLEELA